MCPHNHVHGHGPCWHDNLQQMLALNILNIGSRCKSGSTKGEHTVPEHPME